jgi:hypothetical protein
MAPTKISVVHAKLSSIGMHPTDTGHAKIHAPKGSAHAKARLAHHQV